MAMICFGGRASAAPQTNALKPLLVDNIKRVFIRLLKMQSLWILQLVVVAKNILMHFGSPDKLPTISRIFEKKNAIIRSISLKVQQNTWNTWYIYKLVQQLYIKITNKENIM